MPNIIDVSNRKKILRNCRTSYTVTTVKEKTTSKKDSKSQKPAVGNNEKKRRESGCVDRCQNRSVTINSQSYNF